MKVLISILFFICACNKLQAQINLIKTFVGNDTAGYCCDGELATNAKLRSDDGICIDKWGNLYLADAGNNRIRKIAHSTGIITTIAGTGLFGYNGDSIQATDAELFAPDAVYTDIEGNVIIADGWNHRVRKITISSGIITTIVGTGLTGNSGDGGVATDAKINGPAGLFIDDFGNIYLADLFNNNVRKISKNGIITTVAGNGSSGYSGDGGPATNATLNNITKAIVDNYGNIIIADCYNNVLRKVDANTGIISTISGNGTAGYSGDGGLAVNAKLNNPYGIYINEHNDIIFAEYGNGTIRKIDGTTGLITTVAGTGTPGFSGDGGPATNAQLIPEDLCFDKNGIMYLADYGNNRIRIVYSDKLEVPKIQLSNEIKLYPNPAIEQLTIEHEAGSNLKIYDLLGQEMLSCKIISDKESIKIQALANGNYIVRIVETNGTIQNRMLVKE